MCLNKKETVNFCRFFQVLRDHPGLWKTLLLREEIRKIENRNWLKQIKERNSEG